VSVEPRWGSSPAWARPRVRLLCLYKEHDMNVYHIAEFAVVEIDCQECGDTEELVFDQEDLAKFFAGEAAQMTREEEELLTTSTHIGCWEKMFV